MPPLASTLENVTAPVSEPSRANDSTLSRARPGRSGQADSDRPTQANRFLAIDSIDGEEELLLVGFDGQDAVSRPFRYVLQLLSTNSSIEPQEMMGRRVTFRVGPADGETRWFNGYVANFSAGGRRGDLYVYTAEVVPWLWFLSRRTNCRIFQDLTAVEIVEQIFRDHGFSDYSLTGIRGSYPRRECCVQYRETDLAFVSRLLEDEGIFYFFEHDRDRHRMVLADGRHAHRDCQDERVRVVGSGNRAAPQGITAWGRQGSLVPRRWDHVDYNYLTPGDDLTSRENSVVDQRAPGNLEVYDNTTEFGDRDQGRRLARLRIEAEEALQDVLSGISTCACFRPGGKFSVAGSEGLARDGSSFVLTSVRHRASEPAAYPRSGRSRSGAEYQNEFCCIPESVPFRPARRTPRSVIYGTQTAVVVGPPGQEIFTDRFGRVKVQFHWDREGNRDDRSSCWVRVAQPWAGARYGVHFWPRIGHEVVVTFIDGDPDRPLIVGSVYNADNMPPYDLPGGQTRSGIKTRSTPNGTPENFNEIRFEDRKGEEELYVHAERTLTTVVEGDESQSVGHDRHVEVKNDDLLDVKETRKVTAKKILLNAGDEIILKCQGSEIKLDAAGITINGTLVRIN